MKALKNIAERVRGRGRVILIPEGHDPRVVRGALAAAAGDLAHLTLFGNRDWLELELAVSGISRGVNVIDTSDPVRFYGEYREYIDSARQLLSFGDCYLPDYPMPILCAADMLRRGLADGLLAGATVSSASIARTALRVVGLADGSALASSVILILLCEPHHSRKGALAFSDCSIVVEPNATQLAEIAVQSANTFMALTDDRPQVALLSYSTLGSAADSRIDRVRQAVQSVRSRWPELIVDGEMQFDAAFLESAHMIKSPQSPLKGHANVLVFPNLEAANIGYKIAERIGKARAIGPLFQGFARPVNDLSRACDWEDVLHMIAVTALQSTASPIATDNARKESRLHG